jgi:23S rRNA pseudouridine2605 synthase
MPFDKFYKKPVQKKDSTPKRIRRKPAPRTKQSNTPPPQATNPVSDEPMRLNKYVSNAGICSRRKADELIAAGDITVNDEIIKEPGHRVQPGDTVIYKDRKIFPRKNFIYVLINKPRGVITTLSDEKGRKTILDIIKGKVRVRVYPVGRLDRETTGLLLVTNDGELTKKLSHPSHEVKKIYHVTLDKALTETHLLQIKSGITLDDGPIKVDGISYVQEAGPNQIGVTLHSGRNRIIRRIFESLGYEVTRLDRVYYAGLTKKDLPRGRMRFLTEQEVIMLQHFT